MSKTGTDLAPDVFRAVGESIENMAFMEVTHGTEAPTGEVSWASISIDDPIRDRLYLGIPLPLLRQLTGSVFGLDEAELTEQMLRDTLAELLNTLGGVLFTRILPPQVTYQLGLPEHGTGPFPKTPADDFCWCMQLEDAALILAADGNGLATL